MLKHYSLEHISRAVSLKHFDVEAARQIMAPRPRTASRPPGKAGTARRGAVLILLFEKHGATRLVLIKRQDSLPFHPGQVAFPGGRREKDETWLQTALRETAEEIGILSEEVSVLGELQPLYIPPSDFIVRPFVAWHANRPCYAPNPLEVAGIIETDLKALADPACRCVDIRRLSTGRATVPCFRIDGHRVWGATAMILSELIERLRMSV